MLMRSEQKVVEEPRGKEHLKAFISSDMKLESSEKKQTPKTCIREHNKL